MKKTIHKSCAILAGLLLAAQAVHAQTYSIDWYKIAGGGGTSTGATYQIGLHTVPLNRRTWCWMGRA